MSRSRRLALLALVTLVAGALVHPRPAAAQFVGGALGGTPQASSNPSVQVTPHSISFPTPAAADFLAGYVSAPAITVTYGNRHSTTLTYSLSLQSLAPTLGGYGKPLSDLQFRVGGSGSWQPVTSTGQVISTGTGQTTVTVYFRMLLHWATDVAGSYGTTLTLAAN